MKFCSTKLSKTSGLLIGLAIISSAVSAQTVKIGWLSSLTGPLSSAAIAENQGVQLAVEEINKSGGILGKQIELLTRDTAGDPTKAVNFAQQLAFSDKVQFVIGPVNSGEGLATTPILARAGVPNIIIGAIDQLTDATKYPRAFRAINTNLQWISTANNYALDTLKKTKVAIIADTSGYGTSSAKTAEELLAKAGITPVYSVLVDANKTDLTDEMTKAKAAGADVVMPWSAATGLLARMLNARGNMGWDVPVVGHPAIMASQIRKLLNKPQYWENTYAAGYASTTYGADGKLQRARRNWSTRSDPSSVAVRSICSFGGWPLVTTRSRSSSMPPRQPVRQNLRPSRRRWKTPKTLKVFTLLTAGVQPSEMAFPIATWRPILPIRSRMAASSSPRINRI